MIVDVNHTTGLPPPAARAYGRESQKNRTRKALVAAAGELMRGGRNPTVADVAEAAEISRATAYRYFPTQEMLLAEVALFAASGPLFHSPAQGLPLSEAVGQLVRRVATWAYTNEQPLRTILRLSLDPSTGVRRPAHRVEWIVHALAPARDKIDPETSGKLSRALTLVLGIDPVVVMKRYCPERRVATALPPGQRRQRRLDPLPN